MGKNIIFPLMLFVALTTGIACGGENNPTHERSDETHLDSFSSVMETRSEIEDGEYFCHEGTCGVFTKSFLTDVPEKERFEIIQRSTSAIHLQESRREEAEVQTFELLERLRSDESPYVRLSLELQELDFNFSKLAHAETKGDRSTHLKNRETSLIEEQNRFLNSLSGLDIKLIGADSLVNVIDVEASRTDAMRIIHHPMVFSASLIEEGGELMTYGSDGQQRANHMRAYNNRVGLAQTGASGGRNNGPVTIAVIECNDKGKSLESNYVNADHPGFKYPYSSSSRIERANLCRLRGFRRRCKNNAAGNVSSHSTAVMSMAGGSILHGQHATYPGLRTVSQWLRSSPAYGTNLQYYLCRRNESGPNMRVGITSAVTNGADIINISYGWKDKCSTSTNHGGVNAALAAARAAGVLTTVSAGNEGTSSSCNVTWPAGRRSVLTVGGLSTNDTPPWSSHERFGEDGIDPGSSRGSMNISLSNGTSVSTPLLSLMAPYRVRNAYEAGSTYRDHIGGTSFSSPIVAGFAATARAHLASTNHPLRFDTNALHAYLLVMGDARASTNSIGITRAHPYYGFGGLRYFERTTAYLGSTYFFNLFTHAVTHGLTNSYVINNGNPLPSNTTGMKFALYVSGDSWSNLPDLNVRVVNTCPHGGGQEVLYTALRQAGIAALRMPRNTVAGKCLRIDVHGQHVRSGGVVYSGAYIVYSNDRKNHMVF